MSYATLAQLKLYLDIGEDDDDVLLDDCLDRAETAIETYTNRCFEATAGTKYYTWDAVDGLWLWLDADLQELTAIANGDSAGTAINVDDVTKWTGDSRNVGPPYNKLRLNDGSDSRWEVDTDYYIEVTADWGYSAEPPNDIMQAAVRLAAYYYRQSDTFTDDVAVVGEGVVSIPRGMPESVKVLLDPYRRMSL